MLPKVSPNSSLKYGPITPCGSVWRTSPTFLRTSYHSAGNSLDRSESLDISITSDSPAREYERTYS